MKREETIKKKDIFNNIITTGHFIKNNYFIIYSSKNEENKINYGIAISKKVGKAYLRNRLKRQVRAIIDNNRKLFQNNYNYIIMIRKSCSSAKYVDLEKALKDLLTR